MLLNIPETIKFDPFVYENYRIKEKKRKLPFNKLKYPRLKYKKIKDRKLFNIQHIKFLRKYSSRINEEKDRILDRIIAEEEEEYIDTPSPVEEIFDEVLRKNIEKEDRLKFNRKKKITSF